MGPRRHLLAVLALSLVPLTAATSSHAVPRGCVKFTDGSGDASTASLDIKGGTVTTDKKKKTLTGKLTVGSTDPSTELAAPLGTSWFLNFVGRGKNYSFERRESAGVSNRTVTNSMTGGTNGAVAPKVTVTKTTFTFTVPLKAVPGVAGGSMICGLSATTRRLGQTGDAA